MNQPTLLEQTLRLIKPKKALHIGASFGQEARLYHQLGVETWHIEAIPDVFDRLKENLSDLNDQHPINACLSNVAGLKTNFHIASNEGMSSSLLPLERHQYEYPSITYEKEITVITETVDSLISSGLIDSDINFILIDAQGAELKILEGGQSLLNSGTVMAAITETAVVALYDGGSTYIEISRLLLNHDLHLRQAVFCEHGWTDALYMKPYWYAAKPETEKGQILKNSTEEAAYDSEKSAQAEGNGSNFRFFLLNENAIADTTEFSAWDKPAFEEDILNAIDLLIPKACSHELIRIGGHGDGAYLVPNDLESIDACFSPGVSDLTKFEQELADRFSIHSYMCDASTSEDRLHLDKTYHHFIPFWLGSYDGENTLTLDSWVANSEHAESRDLLLQMDVEGSEFASLIAASDSTLSRFRIAVIEFHWLWKIQSSRFLNTRFLPTLQKLSKHFDCVHAHGNNCCGTTSIAGFNVPNVIELTYLRKDRNKSLHPPLIPHPLDVVNVPSNPPLILGRPWSTSN
jgi:FkbM family methyltransferase